MSEDIFDLEDDNGLPKIGPYAGGEFKLALGFVAEEQYVNTLALREMTGAEEDMLTDHTRGANTVLDVLKQCVVSLGPWKGNEAASRMHLLPQCDATLAAVRLRQLSLGDEFTFTVKCPNPACKQEDPNVSVNLAERGCKYHDEGTDQPVRDVYDGVTKSGLRFTYRVLTIGDQPKLAQIKKQKQNQKVTMLMYFQVRSLDGVTVASPKDLEKLPSRVRNEIRIVIDEAWFGMDTYVEHECRFCNAADKLVLPISSEARFFFPSAIKRS